LANRASRSSAASNALNAEAQDEQTWAASVVKSKPNRPLNLIVDDPSKMKELTGVAYISDTPEIMHAMTTQHIFM
jgi:hypothetical protein